MKNQVSALAISLLLGSTYAVQSPSQKMTKLSQVGAGSKAKAKVSSKARAHAKIKTKSKAKAKVRVQAPE